MISAVSLIYSELNCDEREKKSNLNECKKKYGKYPFGVRERESVYVGVCMHNSKCTPHTCANK
jgi:hypothetical protein